MRVKSPATLKREDRVVVRIFNRRKNTCNRGQALEAACGFGSCVSSFQDSSAGNFLGIAGDFFRLPAFIYIPGRTCSKPERETRDKPTKFDTYGKVILRCYFLIIFQEN